MIALCHVSPLSLAQLQRALPSPHTVANASSWSALLVRMHQSTYDVLVVDPCAGDERLATVRLRDMANALVALPPRPIVGYLSVTATSIRAVQALSRLGALEIVIRGVDDAPSALASAIQRAITAHSANQLAASLRPSLAMLPPGVTEALQLLLRSPDRLRSVTDLVIAAKTTRRSLDRWLARAGLAPARTLLACARANAAFHLLVAGRMGRSQAAALVGYSSARSLTRELHAITGCAPSAIVEELTPDAFTAALSRRLVRVPAACRD